MVAEGRAPVMMLDLVDAFVVVVVAAIVKVVPTRFNDNAL